jgi:hypothetical protein
MNLHNGKGEKLNFRKGFTVSYIRTRFRNKFVIHRKNGNSFPYRVISLGLYEIWLLTRQSEGMKKRPI